jgi:quercetin dioxygenase-like cupin family protein
MVSDDSLGPFATRPASRATFSPHQGTKADLFRGDHLFLGLNSFEPGQTQPVHAHQGADKFYLIVSGKARMSVDGREWVASEGELIWAPADVLHGVVSALERTVMLVGIAPGPRPRR